MKRVDTSVVWRRLNKFLDLISQFLGNTFSSFSPSCFYSVVDAARLPETQCIVQGVKKKYFSDIATHLLPNQAKYLESSDTEHS